jgi:hypothetical protein
LTPALLVIVALAVAAAIRAIAKTADVLEHRAVARCSARSANAE